MKYAECNARQKKAYRNIYHACNWLLGGLENTMLDNPEGSEEYENAKATLANHDGLVAELYSMATTDVYDDGTFTFCGSDPQYQISCRSGESPKRAETQSRRQNCPAERPAALRRQMIIAQAAEEARP